MSKPNILIIWSNYYAELSEQHLKKAMALLDASSWEYQVETVHAGVYELPHVMAYASQHWSFDGYLPLGLLLKGNTDHYEFIWEHLQRSFTHFALQGLSFGNGVITALDSQSLQERVEKGERVLEAVRALRYLLSLAGRPKKYSN